MPSKMCLLVNDIAYRFGVSQATVYHKQQCIEFFLHGLILYFSFHEINLWPSRQQINDFMPQAFKDIYPTTWCITDATEIYIQIPSTPKHSN